MASSAIAQKALLNKSIQFKDGEFRIWGIRAAIFSNYALAYLMGALNKINDKKGIDGIYWMGYHQAVGAAILTEQKFGIKKKVLENVVGQGDMLGYGPVTIKKEDFNTATFTFELKSSVAKEFIAVFGPSPLPVCHHMRGLYAGTVGYLTKKDVCCIETKCIAKGDKVCLFTVKPTKTIPVEFKFQIPQALPSPEQIGDKRKARMLKKN